MYCSIYADRTYGDSWSLLIYSFTSTGGIFEGGSAPFAIIVDSSMLRGILGGGLTPIIIFDLNIIGESRSAGSLSKDSNTPLGLTGIIRPIESLIGIPRPKGGM